MPGSEFDKLPRPPCAEMLDWKLVEIDKPGKRVVVSFTARQEFVSSSGFIQGGMLAAMLDDTMGSAAFVISDGRQFPSSIDMNVSFLAPAKVGKIFGEGTAVQLGKTIGYLQGELRDEAGTLLARATSSARMVTTEVLPTSHKLHSD